jgi:hypothetical protein
MASLSARVFLVSTDREGGRMSEREENGGTVVELLLREPEIVAWLDPRADEDEPEDDPPRAA